jgi:UDP-3-O-acyl N-acetylglucosamine deacetylase
MQRRTIEKEVELEGIALHSGSKSRVNFKPAKAGAGILFVRADLGGRPAVKASPENVSETKRGTSLRSGGAGVQLTEHVLAAVHSLGISDIEIEVFGEEPPAMDGSSIEFFNALKKAKLVDLKDKLAPIKLEKELLFEDGESIIQACPSDRLEVCFVVDFPGTPIGKQELSLEINERSFEKEIAPARTFGFIEEVEELKKRGLALGASLKNALAISRREYINKPRFKDEVVRHKILDVVGDLGLLGRPIQASIIAKSSGHRLNVLLASALAKEVKK